MHSFLLYNLSQTIKSQITIEIFTEFLKEIRSHLNISLFIEVLWISGLELDKSEKIEKNFKDYKKNYNTIITQLETSGLVNSDILLERLDETQIKETNLIDYNQFRRKTSRINTKLK